MKWNLHKKLMDFSSLQHENFCCFQSASIRLFLPWNKVHFADDFGLCLKRHSRHNIREMIYEGKLASITECGFLLFHILANSNERNAIWPTTIPNKLSIFHDREPQNTISQLKNQLHTVIFHFWLELKMNWNDEFLMWNKLNETFLVVFNHSDKLGQMFEKGIALVFLGFSVCSLANGSIWWGARVRRIVETARVSASPSRLRLQTKWKRSAHSALSLEENNQPMEKYLQLL